MYGLRRLAIADPRKTARDEGVFISSFLPSRLVPPCAVRNWRGPLPWRISQRRTEAVQDGAAATSS